MNASFLSATSFIVCLVCASASATDYAPPAERFIPQAPSAPLASTFIPDVPTVSRPTFQPNVPTLANAPYVAPPDLAPPATVFEPQVTIVSLPPTTPPPDSADPAQRFIPQPPIEPPAQRFYP